MDKSFQTVLELRWDNPRLIYDDGISILFYANGDRHDHWVVCQEKEGLKNFYRLDERYRGNLWIPETDFGLCKWIQNVVLALEKNGVSRNNMYLATKEIFSMKDKDKDDPTDEKTIDRIFEILKKYFGNLNDTNRKFNRKDWVNVQDPGYNFVYRYDGIGDIIHLFLTGYLFHYGNCIRYISDNSLFNKYRSLKYKDLFYRAIFYTGNSVDENRCYDISRICFQHFNKIESKDETVARIRDSIIASELGIEKILVNGNISMELPKERKKEIIEKIDKEILENEKEKIDEKEEENNKIKEKLNEKEG